MRFILAILLLLLASPCSASTEIIVIGQPTGADYSDIIFWVDFPADSITLETNNCNSGTDTSWALASAADINATAKLYGDYGMDIPGAEDTATITITSEDYLKNAIGAIVFMVQVVTSLGNEAMLWIAGSSANSYITIVSGDELRLSYNGESVVTTPDANIAVDTPYYVCAIWDAAAENKEIHVYNSSGVEQGSGATNSEAISNLAATSIVLGDFGGSNTKHFYIDKVVVFSGSIVRTAQQYVDIVRLNSACPR